MTLSYALDTAQGFTFTPGSRDSIGSLTAATICGTTLNADLTVTDPVTNASTPAVDVVKQILSQQIASTAVTLNFGVYQYAAAVQKYFCAFTPQQPPLNAVISQAGGALFLHLAEAPTQITKSLAAYEVILTAGPAAQVQVFTVASTAPGSVAMPWGK